MFRHIRSKLIAAFAVPLAILVAVAGLEVFSSLGQINSVNRQTALASASVSPGGAVADLQTERLYAITDIIGRAGHGVAAPLQGVNPQAAQLSEPPAQVMAVTNMALASFRNTVVHAGSQAQSDFAPALSNIGTRLAQARALWAGAAAGKAVPVSSYAHLEVKTYNQYTDIIDSLAGATAPVPLQISDPTLRTGVEALSTSLLKTEAQYGVLQDLMVLSEASPSAQAATAITASNEWGALQDLSQRLGSLSQSAYGQAIKILNGNSIDASLALYVSELPSPPPSLQTILGTYTQPAQGATVNSTTGTATNAQLGDAQIAAVVASRAQSLHTNAVTQAIAFGAVGAIGILLGLGVVILVSRSISRPLVNLAHQAERLASETLPATVQSILEAGTAGTELPKAPEITVSSRDEVAQMAEALDAVQQTAVELAASQAALRKSLADAFINLGRRNQNLITRQLEYISEIELKEADPESLEELFRLDHLATRMRRNAESLLILAGSGPARQWSAAVPAMDVARAGSAEVEDYKRLRLHHFDPAMITGAVTTDLVHIMAELTENALTFSPPGSPVDIYGRFLEGGYVIVIVDSGIGMSADDLEVANRRLEGEGSENEVPGRYLGHFVAGRLARRHGIAISLQASHSGGLVARVKIPTTLIEDPVPDLSAGAELASTDLANTDLGNPDLGNPDLASAGLASAEDALAFSSAPAPSFEPVAPAAGPAGPAYVPAPTAGSSDALASDLVAPSVGPFGTEALDRPETTTAPPVDLVPVEDGPGYQGVYGGRANGPTNDPGGQSPATGGGVAELPAWAKEANAPSWDDEPEPQDVADPGSYVIEAPGPVHEPAAIVKQEPVAQADVAVQVEAKQQPPVEPLGTTQVGSLARADLVARAEPVAQPQPVGQARPVAQAEVVAQAKPVAKAKVNPPARSSTPDLGATAPLVAGTVPAEKVPVVAVSSWDPAAHAAAAAAGAGPAAQARSTAEGLRKLTRRVPGASLPQEDDSLKRATPTTTGRNPLGLTGALSQYLSATSSGESRAEKEQNLR